MKKRTKGLTSSSSCWLEPQRGLLQRKQNSSSWEKNLLNYSSKLWKIQMTENVPQQARKEWNKRGQRLHLFYYFSATVLLKMKSAEKACFLYVHWFPYFCNKCNAISVNYSTFLLSLPFFSTNFSPSICLFSNSRKKWIGNDIFPALYHSIQCIHYGTKYVLCMYSIQ